MGQRHNLESIMIMNLDGTMNEKAGAKYNGMTREDCRKAVVADLKELGLLDHIEELTHAVGHCSRCKTTVEPFVTKQWFVKMKPLTEAALKAVEDGHTKFIPDRFVKIYNHWLEDVHDWCISRQLWWGHQIPVCTATTAASPRLAGKILRNVSTATAKTSTATRTSSIHGSARPLAFLDNGLA